ncbi:MAG: efflux RND transporter periplasmic adaptor subunit [Paracoccaceae bacterium]
MQDEGQGSGRADGPQLDFADEPGAARSGWVALALVLALGGWMGSGFLLPGEESAAPDTQRDESRPVAVAVRDSSAEEVREVFRAEGQAEPERDTRVRAETTGEVAELSVRRGAEVEAGQTIARIAPAQRQAELERAREEEARARRDYDNARTLLDRGVATADRVAQTRASLAAAEAQVAAAEESLADTTIRAPFAGRLEELTIEPGEFVQAGSAVARVVDLTPLTVEVQVPQTQLAALEEGQEAEVRFITGETRQGRVTFVGRAADASTRTFAAEIEVANEDGAIPAGISAEVRIPTGTRQAHFLSPAILSLDAQGRLGVKTVDAEETVVFHEVEIVRARPDGVWVSGLPDSARIITVGQGFVSDGEAVAPQPEEDLGIGRLRGGADAAAAGGE